MKQLKFMLAAATAISLATAAQAARFSGSTDFEGDFDLATEFTYSGTAGDNESAIIPGVPTDVERPANNGFTATPANVLQVNTGTEPIVRNIDGGTDVVLNGGAVYIDTLVKFTVTPENDTVEPTKVDGVIQDKLMVYLRDEGDAGKNLYVVAGYYDGEDVLKYDSYLIKSNVDPDVWHRLVVKAIDDISGGALGGKFPGFQIYLDGDAESNMCVSDSYMADMTGMLTPETGMFLSMKSAESTASSGLSSVTLTSVGFAGEGKVDDLVISTFDPSKTVVDFTLTLAGDVADGLSGNATYASSAAGTVTLNSGENACVRYSDENVTISYSLAEGYKAEWSEGGSASFAPTAGTTYTLTVSRDVNTVDFTLALGEGVSAVQWTIGGVTQTANSGTVEDGQLITIVKVTYADWYGPTGTYVDGYEFAYSEALGTGIKVEAKELTSADLDVTVPEGTATATVDAALAWAKAANKSTTDVESATNLIANYLLNVTDLTDEPQIKITGIDLSGAAPTVTAEVTTSAGTTIKTLTADNINEAAAIKYKAAATLEALKSATSKAAIEAGDQFIQVVVDVK